MKIIGKGPIGTAGTSGRIMTKKRRMRRTTWRTMRRTSTHTRRRGNGRSWKLRLKGTKSEKRIREAIRQDRRNRQKRSPTERKLEIRKNPPRPKAMQMREEIIRKTKKTKRIRSPNAPKKIKNVSLVSIRLPPNQIRAATRVHRRRNLPVQFFARLRE